jgi:F-type H+-transporting ATPase subunit a
VPEPAAQKKIIGLSKGTFIVILLVILGLSILSFLAGAVGRKIVGDVGLPSWMIVGKPAPELPAEAIGHIGSLAITNTMLTAWISMAVVVLLFWAATRKMKLIPGRLQSFAESTITYLFDFCTDIAGEKNGRRFFPLVATIFLFVITNAWMNLIPGYGSILINGVPLFRGANTDINFPLALAIISFVMVTYWGLKSVGFGHFMGTFFNFKKFGLGLKQLFTGNFKQAPGNLLMGMMDIFIGFIELLSYLIRIVSFTFRLFGNMTGGEILLLSIAFLVPFVFGSIFYGLELFFGYIQALIFGGLTLVFAHMAVSSHGGEEEPHTEGSHS